MMKMRKKMINESIYYELIIVRLFLISIKLFIRKKKIIIKELVHIARRVFKFT